MAQLPIPQPATEFYPSSALNLFTERQRTPSDPRYNPIRRPKYWIDDSQSGASDPSAFVQYTALHELSDGTFVQSSIYMPAAEAASYNFPDALPPNVSQPAATPPLPAAWPVPQRALLPNEEIVPGALPGTPPIIHRTDISSSPAVWSVSDKILLIQAARKILGG